jgi:hypothetical protein
VKLDLSLPLELAVLKDVVGRLEAAGLDYMLSGSLALSFYATPRMTRDIDVVVALSAASLDILRRAFEPDYYVPDDLATAMLAPGMFNLLHLDAVMKVDVVVRKDDAYRLAEFERRTLKEMGSFAAWVVSREDLILSKLLWARESRSEQQIRDVRALLEGQVDLDYLASWAARLGIADLLGECRR